MTLIMQTDSGESRLHAARYEYQVNPTTRKEELHIFLLNGQEANYSNEKAYDDVVKSRKFCLVKTNLVNQVTMIQPPVEESYKLAEEGTICHVYKIQKDNEKEEIKPAPGIKLNAMVEEDIIKWGAKFRDNFIRTAGSIESAKPLTGRAVSAPSAPKENGFFGKLFGKRS